MPTTSLDTFFACTILVSIVLIATAFLGATMQARISNTQNLNKQNYLNTVAEYLIKNTGSPVQWGASAVNPEDFGLAPNNASYPYELDIDKISRLNNYNNYSLSYVTLSNSAKLNNIALGIAVSQLFSIKIELINTVNLGANVSYTFSILTSENATRTAASLGCYVVASNFLTYVTNSTSSNGIGYVTVEIPSAATNNALLVVFVRSSFDQRTTSYAVYNFATSKQESTPGNTVLSLSPLNYTLTLSSSTITVQKAYVFSYAYQSNLTILSSTKYAIPMILDQSPLVMVISGLNGGVYFQEWVAYPQVPFRAGANFEDSEQNIFSYIVVIKEALYRVDISFGDVFH